MYRHDSLYRQRGLATSSANLDSTIPLDYLHILYIFIFYCFIFKYLYTAKNKRWNFPVMNSLLSTDNIEWKEFNWFKKKKEKEKAKNGYY